jgi:hypothetical protein
MAWVRREPAEAPEPCEMNETSVRVAPADDEVTERRSADRWHAAMKELGFKLPCGERRCMPLLTPNV